MYFCLFEDPMQLSPATILGWTAIFDFHVEGQRADCFLQTSFLAFVNRHVISDRSTTQVTHQHGSLSNRTRHILRTVSVNIQRLTSKCWWAFQKHTSEENTPPPKGKPCDAQGILSFLTQEVPRRDGKAGYCICEKAVCIKGNSNTALCRWQH